AGKEWHWGRGRFATPIAQHALFLNPSVVWKFTTRESKKKPTLFIMRHQKNLVFSEKLINVHMSLVKMMRTLFVKWCPQTDMPSERRCNLHSKIRWFTKFCNSHYLSHFA